MEITEKIRIYNEDCLEAIKKMPDNAYDLAIVDPPYGIERFKKPSGGTRFNSSKLMQEQGLTWDKKPSKDYWFELFRVTKNQIVWGANNFEMPPSEYFCIWSKEQPVPNFASAEYAWVSMGLRKPAKVFTYSIMKHNHTNKIHPTQKPVKLYEWLLDNYAKEGDRILDTHLGSGSIAIACHNRGLDLTAYEIDKDYFSLSLKRIQDHVNQLTIFE